MCGIAGFKDKVGADEAGRLLGGMLSVMRYRGPDDAAGYWEDGAAIGMVRLSIVDIGGGSQPAFSDDGAVSLVFNGEIFNYLELRAELMAKGEVFSSHSEVELLLHLYLREGAGMMRRLNGQFAIAVLDKRSDSLILFRDPFGIRPLFWRTAGSSVWFGSEIKALLAYPGCGRALDPAALVQTLRFWTVAGETTAFTGIRQVPPGHVVTFKGDDVRVERAWSWPFHAEVEPLKLGSDEEYCEAFRSELDAAVGRQRMADVEVGSYLSGGIDSTVLAMLAGKHADGGLKTFSVGFDDPQYDETSAQTEAAKAFGFRHHAVTISDHDIGEIFPTVVRHAEAPLFRTAPAPLYLLSRRVKEAGLKVVFTGEGADEILLGYDLFREVAIRRFWGRMPNSPCRPKLFQRLYHYLPQYREPRFRNMMTDMYRGTLSRPEDRHYAMSIRWGQGQATEMCLAPQLRSAMADVSPLAELERWLPAGYDAGDDIERAQVIEVSTLMGNYLLSSQGDRMSLANSVEGRYPYLDLDFVRFAARLPRNVKLRGLRDKFILRRSYRGRIPDAIVNRPKVAYQAPEMKAFFTPAGPLPYVQELLSEERLKDAGLFDPGFIAHLLAKAQARPFDRMGFRDNMAFVVALSTMILHDTFVRGRDRIEPISVRRAQPRRR